MELTFSQPAANHRFSVKCLPVSDEMQELVDCKLEILPVAPHSYSLDAFGNRLIYGLIERPHQSFQVKLAGKAKSGMRSGHTIRPQTLAMYRYQSVMTKPGETLQALRETIDKEWEQAQQCAIQDIFVSAAKEAARFDIFAGRDAAQPDISAARDNARIDVFALADYYTEYLYQNMKYTPGVTNTDTTAEEAAALGCGVCQDYAHIMLSLLRMHHVPCRYVVGLMTGEGASHAWVEAACDGEWRGFDPTNGRRVDDTYLYISFGRDAKDCPMNRGVLAGGGTQTQTVYVCVEEEAQL